MRELEYTKVTPDMGQRSPYKIIAENVDDHVVYINMWIGRDGRYVLPNVGVVVENHYKMHNDMLKSMRLPKLSKEPFYYIPRIDYHVYVKKGVDNFVESNTKERLILICNGNVHSNQAKNFDFTPVIGKICDTFPEYQFVETQKTELVKENLAYTGDIIGETPGTDLNEISYLSTFCDVSIGRNSGPHVFSQVLDNWVDKYKTNLSFTYAKNSSHFVLSDDLPMKKEWSGAEDTQGVFKKICEVIG